MRRSGDRAAPKIDCKVAVYLPYRAFGGVTLSAAGNVSQLVSGRMSALGRKRTFRMASYSVAGSRHADSASVCRNKGDSHINKSFVKT